MRGHRELPGSIDLILIIGLSILSLGVFTFLPPSALRTGLAGALLFFSPGYALVELVSPRVVGIRDLSGNSLSLIERLALAIAASIVVSALWGMVLAFIGPGIRSPFSEWGLVGITIVLAVVGMLRRKALTIDKGISVWTVRRNEILAVGLGAVIIVGMMSVGGFTPPQDPHLSQFYLTDSAGRLDFETAQSETPVLLQVHVVNRNLLSTNYSYTIERTLGTYNTDGGQPIGFETRKAEVLGQWSKTLRDDEEWVREHEFDRPPRGYIYRYDLALTDELTNDTRSLRYWLDPAE